MKKHFLTFIIVSSAFFFSCTEKIIYENGNPNSTTGSIVGVVLQNESNAKIIVRQEIPVDSTFIDASDGSFRIESLPIGNYDLYVKAENYGTYRIHNVLVNAGGITYVGELSLSEVPDLVSSFYPQDKSEIVFETLVSAIHIFPFH